MDSRIEGVDKSPYLSEEAIDPKWLEVIQSGDAVVAEPIDGKAEKSKI
jgi:hypothetical protein